MIKWPWVSREAYEERGRRVRSLEQHIASLQDLIIPVNTPFLATEEDGSVDLPTVEVRESEDDELEAEFIERERTRLLSGDY